MITNEPEMDGTHTPSVQVTETVVPRSLAQASKSKINVGEIPEI